MPNPAKFEENSMKKLEVFQITLRMDFLWISVRFWRQVGSQNGAKIDMKGGWKNDLKMMMTRMAKKSDIVATTGCGTMVLTPGEEG